MKLLILGGTGIISLAVAERAVLEGFEVTVVNRGSSPPPVQARQLVCDVNDEAAMSLLLGSRHFDVTADFLTFTPAQAAQRLRLFQGRTDQYLFISSATVYQKPPAQYLMTEGTPLGNPYSEYARNKIACEAAFTAAWREAGFPVTIVRPSYTYGDKSLPFVLNSHAMRYTLIHRLRAGKPIVVPGDGNVFWTITHSSDFARAFAGLMGNTQAIGHAFHITSDQAMTWDMHLNIIARAAGCEPKVLHIATDSILRDFPEERGALLGDKSQTAIFDNTKIKTFVPGFACAVSFEKGVRSTLAYYESHKEMQGVDWEWDRRMDLMVKKHLPDAARKETISP